MDFTDWTLTEVDPPDGLVIKVHPATVPTTASPYHPSATHIDALGMPVAFTDTNAGLRRCKNDACLYYALGDEQECRNCGSAVAAVAPDLWPYHPTPCCGSAASINDGPMYCKGCYHEVDPAFGNHPVEPYRPIMSTDSDNPLEASIARARKEATVTENTDKPLTTMEAVAKVLRRSKKPLSAREIAVKVVPMVAGLKGKTPEATVAAKVYTEAKKPDGILVRVEGGFIARRAA